jgi:hypothetical protein
MSEDGNNWVYRTEQGLQAQCSYTYMKVENIQQWRGVLFKRNTDFMGGTQRVEESGLEELAGCVAWVEHHLVGGYWL